MAIRTLRIIGDDILTKTAKPVKKITDRTKILVEDMAQTMYESEGVGLAAPQVGILKRIFVVDISEEKNELLAFINPEILEAEGEQIGVEGCLSVPGRQGMVKRPKKVIVKAQDVNGNEFSITAEDFLARAICHENDHLNGILYTTKLEEAEEV